MEIPEDFKELLRSLNSNKVDYLIVGGYALGHHGVPRYTGDLDLFVAANRHNAVALLRSFDEFGFGSLDLKSNDFTEPGNIIQIGYPPIRVDFLTQITGVEWEEAWKSRVETKLGGVPVQVISREHLIQNKKATGRPVDLGDVDRLE